MRPRLIVLDACGVILNDPLPGHIEAIGRALGEDPVETFARYAMLRPAFWTGKMEEEAFWWELTLGHDAESWARRLAASFGPGPAAERLASWARVARLRVLSNHRSRWMDGHLARLGLRDHFERVLVSEAIGHAKPEVEAFEVALRDTEVQRGEVLFVDDKQRNVLVARGLGLQAVWADPGRDWVAEVDGLLASSGFAGPRPRG